MIGGVLLVMALYLLVNLSLLRGAAAGAAGRARRWRWAAAVDGDLRRRAAAAIVQVVAIICLVGAINAYHLMASRIPLAMAGDGLLPPALSRG